MDNISPVYKQFLLVVCSNLLTFGIGISASWATVNFIELQKENDTFISTGPLSLEEASLVISLVNVGGLIGNFAILPISRFIGIKATIHYFGIPLILSSLLIIYTKNLYYLYISRLLSGIVGGGLFVGIPTLINDISNDNVRGALNSLYNPSLNFGVMFAFFLGNYLSCLDQAKMQLIVPTIFIFIFSFFPESPEYWVAQQKEKRAIEAHKFYKGDIKTIGKNNVIDNTESTICRSDFFTPEAKKAFFISFISLMLSLLSGTLVMLSYITVIFTKSGSSLSTKNSSLLVSMTQLIGNLICTNIIERINRRTLYICSSISTAISFLTFALYCFLWNQKPQYEWMPPFCFVCIIFCGSIGLLPIPYILTVEIFPKKIRQTCLSIAVSLMWIVSFCIGIIFPICLETFGLTTCMITFGIFSFLNAVFGFYFVPETRGKSYDDIMDLLRN